MISTKRDMPALTRNASFSPASVNADKRTVDLVWSTGAQVRRYDWDTGSYMEELSLDPAHVRLDRLNNGAPFLADHDSYRIASTLGVVESATVDGKQGVATVRFAKAEDDPEADRVFRKIKDGILQNVSVGYRVHKMEKVEGGDSKIPTMRATDWTPFEISLVTIGADDGAGVRSARAEMNVCEVLTRGEALQEVRKMEVEAKNVVTPAVDVEAVRVETLKVERERVAGIRTAVSAAKLGDEFAAKLVDGGVSLDRARETVLAEMVKRSNEVEIEGHIPSEVGETHMQKFMRGAESGLLARYGQMNTIEAASKKSSSFKNIDVDPGEFRSFRPARLAQEFLELKGKRTRGMSDDQIVREALEFRSGGMNTISDYAVLLENVMYKTLLGNYTIVDDTWKLFCKTDSVQDFRPSNRYRTSAFGTLDSLDEHGEFKNKSIPDGAKLSISTATKGNIVALTRQAIVNDDMGAIMDTIGKLGRAAGLSIESDTYALLNQHSGLGPYVTGTTPFFDASFGNVSTGAALSVAALDADRVAMASQKDPSGNEYIVLKPSVLLVPVGLGGAARVMVNARYDTTSGSAFETPNRISGFFNTIIDTPRLSGTRRYSFCDPNAAAAIVVAFLNGVTSPMLEQKLGWRADGVEWKIRLDYLVQMFDTRAAITNAGA